MAKRKASAPNPEVAASATARGSPLPPGSEPYTVLARRYRPQQFRELVGQEPVARALINALESNRVAHAYLFTGARGVGKTSAARILAKALNCVKGPTATPCDQCEICQSIAAGEDVDVLEIDGASNNRIDEVREIRQNVQYRPSRCRFKIYIIDEVHMLTTQAFNALLKTLEEPPEHVKFIFATTEVQKIPITILSRCQRFDFAGISPARIVDRLRAVVAQEGMQADDDALELIARRAGGSMRDAQSLLDQLLAFGGERLTCDQIHQMLGTAHDDRVLALASAVLSRDARQALDLLAQAANEGLQLGEFLDQLIAYWRDLMVAHCGGSEAKDLSVAPRHRDLLLQQASQESLDSLLAGLEILGTVKARLRGSSHARTLIELALVRLSRLENLIALSQLAETLGQAPTAPRAQPAGSTSAAPAAPGATLAARNTAAETIKKKLTTEDSGPAKSLALAPETLTTIWQEVKKGIGHILGNMLERAGVPAILGPNTLVLRFPSDYNVEREQCQRPASLARIETALAKVTGQPCTVRIEASGSEAPVPNGSAREDSENTQSRYRRLRTEAMKEPLVARAIEVLGAQLLDADEGFGSALASPGERGEPVDGEES